MNTTVTDNKGNKIPTTKSHANTKAVLLRIAELKIAAYGLKDTPEEYLAKCQIKAVQS